MLSLQSSPLLMKIMKIIQLPFTLALSLWWSWTMTHMTRNCLPSLKLSRFGGTIWKVRLIPSTLLWIIRTLSIFLLLTWRQAWWFEYLSQFNIAIRFRPGHLGTKLDALTRWWDIYPKGGNTGYATVNPHNFKPIFTQKQFTASVWATVLLFPSLCTATVVDLDTLHQDILSALPSDLIATKNISTDGRWSTDPNGLLLLDNRIYVPSAGNLCTRVLQYNHDHILAKHFGQNKILELVCHEYSWSSLHVL